MPPLVDHTFQTPLLRFVNPSGHEVDFLRGQVGMQETVLPAGQNLVRTFVQVAGCSTGSSWATGRRRRSSASTTRAR